MSIQISLLSKSYQDQPALSGVSFEVGPCETVAFLGPNGAGKTTCMKILTGGLAPDSGQALVCGFDPFRQPRQARRCFGYLPEHNPLYPEMYVREYLEFTAGLYGISRRDARIDKALEETLLTDVAHKPIHTLSRGYRQRTGLAAALLPDAPVLILDEPLSGLDPNQQEEILSLIRHLGREKSILFSTHTLSEVEKVARRVLILSRGELKADAPLEELIAHASLEETFKTLTR